MRSRTNLDAKDVAGMTKALIIGSGIAGPVTAMALQKVGIDAVVYESRPADVPDVGTYLTVALNGIAALRVIDAHQAVMGAGFPPTAITFYPGSGLLLHTVPIGKPLPDGTATQTVRRADL